MLPDVLGVSGAVVIYLNDDSKLLCFEMGLCAN